MRQRAALALLACVACDAGLPPCEGDEFIAMQSDFEDYERWRRLELDPADPRLGEGPRSVYINALPPRDATSFPQCTMIVKVGESGPDPTGWLMVGMAKRGGGYNADGAEGWEWFDLDLSPSGVPLIDWRGPSPPEGRGYECALGEEEAAPRRSATATSVTPRGRATTSCSLRRSSSARAERSGASRFPGASDGLIGSSFGA